MNRVIALFFVLTLLQNCSAFAPQSLRIQHHDVSTHADLVIDTPTPHLSWQIEVEDASVQRGLAQVAYQLQVVELGRKNSLIHDSGRVESSQSTFITYQGQTLTPNTRYALRIRYWTNFDEDVSSEWTESYFRTALFDTWKDVPWQWIGRSDVVWNEIRCPFNTSQQVKSAQVYISGIGYYHLFINGQNVDPTRRLDVGWTTYEKRTLYASYDVTTLIQNGNNTIGVWLGSGWYGQEQYRDGVDEITYGPPRLLFWMQIHFTDGTTRDIYSDDQSGWIGRAGAVLHDGVYMGTIYDARLERNDWALANFTDPFTLWLPAKIMPSPLGSTGVMSLQYHDPIRMPSANLHIATSARLHPGQRSQSVEVFGGDLVKDNGGVITPKVVDGCSEGQLFDLGQNIAGWCTIKAKGRRGLAIHIHYSETLQLPNNPQTAKGMYTENLRNAASTDIYVFKSDETLETIEPRFTQHGFRYIEVRGAKHGIDASNIQCNFVHSETTLKGNFTTSNKVINQVQHNILWGQLSNLMSLPTDCDQRDERKGWMGDAGLTVDEALFNFELAAFYHNFMDLIQDIQTSEGGVSDTVPLTYGASTGDPNWSTAYPTIAMALYNHFGDIDIISKHFDSLVKYIEHEIAGYKSTGLANLYREYGDWVPPPPYGQTNGGLIASFPFLRDVAAISKMATLLNQSSIASKYDTLYTQLAKEFHTTFYHNATIGYADGKQTANALALLTPGVVPSALVPAVLNALVTDLKSKGALTTGIVGTAALFPVLSMNGQHDLALQLAGSTKYPSHGYMAFNSVEQATTLWELWDAPNEGPGMNSRNHIMYGSIGAWFYRYCAGIDPNSLEEIHIRPRMVLDASLMPELHAEVNTLKGMITVDYERDSVSNSISLHVTVPANSHAIVSFEPLTSSAKCLELREGTESTLLYSASAGNMYSHILDTPISENGIVNVHRDSIDGTIHVKILSGEYIFNARWA